MSKILVVGSTHGHEKIGLKVIETLRGLAIDPALLDFEIGNPEASKRSVRLIESDLNRVFPGKEHGTHEEMRAYALSEKIRAADVVIDIHSTNTYDLGPLSSLIVTKYDAATQHIVDLIKPPKVLYMTYKNEHALISQARVGIAFEYGHDDSKDVLAGILFDIGEILVDRSVIAANPYINPRAMRETEVFEVYDVFQKDFRGWYTLDPHIENFSLCPKGALVCTTLDTGESIYATEDFYPILFREDSYTEILGFKARKRG
jgi:succinylglutamate desuccinylase